jgi:predicted O-methyltransferase YrrM
MAFITKAFKSLVPEHFKREVRARRASRNFYDYYSRQQIESILPTVRSTGETHNFIYDLKDRSLRYLAETISRATQQSASRIETYIQEAIADRALNDHVLGNTRRSDPKSPFSRRLGWYAVARAAKPEVIVETGVERGHCAVMLCAALLRNAEEGSPGRYYGTDINPAAGRLLSGRYASVGKILYGDSIASLSALQETIGPFINDSDHSAEYEYREYQTVADKLSSKAIILADNAHVTDELALFSRKKGRHFIFFREEPDTHWYPGAGIGISFP